MQRCNASPATLIKASALRTVNASGPRAEQVTTKLIVQIADAQIKIEVTPVLRGCVYELTTMSVTARVEEQFGFAEMPVVSFPDLYAGKIVAALDRQHPRDLFDVRDLLANEGIDDKLRKAFIVYLVSHDRPMSEVLAPPRLEISAEYKRGFEGMVATRKSVLMNFSRHARRLLRKSSQHA